jgi:uncharacterized protein (TIGR03083 family)
MDVDRTVAVIDDARSRLAGAAASPGIPVPSCPGWDVAELVWHTGVVGDFWRQIVDRSLGSPAEYHPGDRPDDGVLARWCAEVLGHLSSVLAAADPSREVWTWSADHSVAFVQRRMAHELAVHAWDADDALGRARPVPVDVAVDGVDEVFDTFFARVAVPERFAAGDGVHLHATDDDLAAGTGEWVVRAEAGVWAVEHRHAKEAFAARAPASDLLLAIWGRVPPDRLATFGDPALFDELVTGLRQSMGSARRS